MIVRGADQLDKDDQGRREDRGDRARPALGGFGSADQNRSSGRLLGPIFIRNAAAVQDRRSSSRHRTPHVTLKRMQDRCYLLILKKHAF